MAWSACGLNCGPPADEAVVPFAELVVEPDEDEELEEEEEPLCWPRAANNASNGLDWVVELPLNVWFGCDSVCR
jgi:hypothetical protein